MRWALLAWYFLVWASGADWTPATPLVQTVGPFDDRPTCEGQRDKIVGRAIQRGEFCFWRKDK